MAAIVRLQRLAAVPQEELSHNARKAVLSAFFRDFCGIAGGNSLHCCGERYENGNFSGHFYREHALARYPQPAVASQESLHLELIHDAEPLCGEPITLRF